jgi:hypothetical protein
VEHKSGSVRHNELKKTSTPKMNEIRKHLAILHTEVQVIRAAWRSPTPLDSEGGGGVLGSK